MKEEGAGRRRGSGADERTFGGARGAREGGGGGRANIWLDEGAARTSKRHTVVMLGCETAEAPLAAAAMWYPTMKQSQARMHLCAGQCRFCL